MRRAILFFALFLIGVLDATAFQESETEPIVWNVSFEGNEAYRSMVLREVISTTSPAFFQKRLRRVGAHRLNETELRRDVIRLERYYQRRGFSDVFVRYEIEDRRKESRKDVIFHIRERQPLQIVSSNIVLNADEQVINEIENSRDYQRAVLRHEFREGQRYQFIRNADVEGRFLQLLENHGYAWPEVEINANVDSLTNRVDVEIQITPNSKTFFTEFIVEGELTVPERVLIRHTDIKKGTPYSRSIMQSAQRSIFNHHLFRFATITIPEQPKDSTLTALIRVREHLPRTIEASIGVGREEYVRGQVGWRHRNINGYGHRFGANIRASFIEQRVSTDYLIPYTFNARSSNVTTLFGVHRLEPSYELLQAGFNSSLIYQIARNRTASFSYEYTFNEELSRDEGASLPEFAVSYNISSFNLSGYYSDGVSRDPRGWVIQPSAEFSSTFNEADFRFQKFSLDVRRFTPITGTTTIAARIATGVIFYSQTDDLPFNIRYFTGGTNSVRGWNRRELGPSVPSFDEDGIFKTYVPIGGRSTFSFNLELRFDSQPELELQDMVSYTLFGKPFYELESWEQVVAGSGSSPTAADYALEVLLDRVELLASQRLGIDVVQIDNTRAGSSNTTSIKTGWYLNQRTFFAILNEVGGSRPKTLFLLEYLLTENLELIILQGDDLREGIDLRWKLDY